MTDRKRRRREMREERERRRKRKSVEGFIARYRREHYTQALVAIIVAYIASGHISSGPAEMSNIPL
jgi:hypothetical protein